MPEPYYSDERVTLYHGDCREVLPTLTAVTAIVTDPPYGINADTKAHGAGIGLRHSWSPIHGDQEPFDPTHLLGYPTVVLFGANHYADRLPASQTWLVWDKRDGLPSKREVGFNDSADVELAWVNDGGPARIYSHRWIGLMKKSEREEPRVHPTQKPVALMRWTLMATTSIDDVICDPYTGSGPTLRAAKDMNRRAIGIEIDERYCEIAAKRLGQEVLDFGGAA
jgi:site-specific DNA-methyltransferase (adenine-specific)